VNPTLTITNRQLALGRTSSSVFSTPVNQSTQQLRVRRTGPISGPFTLPCPNRNCKAVTFKTGNPEGPLNSIE
jgi:hypothetical protein